MNQDGIRTMVRRKLADGSLPHDSIPRFWGGPSDGEECDACGEVINAQQLLMEAVRTLNNQGLQLHVECFYIWDLERDVPGRVGV